MRSEGVAHFKIEEPAGTRTRRQVKFIITFMDTPSQNGMDSKMMLLIKECVQGSFQRLCHGANRMSEYELFHNQLLSNTPEAKARLRTLTERIEFGNNADLEQFVGSSFTLPVGLRFNLIRVLIEECRVELVHLGHQRAKTVHDGYLTSMLNQWKTGKVSPDAMFSGIYRMVAEGSLQFSEAQNLVELILREGGRNSFGPCTLIGRSQIVSSVGTILEVSSVHSTPMDAEIFTHEGDFLRVEPEQMRRTEIYHTSSECMSSTSSFLWEHVGSGLDHLEYRAAMGNTGMTHLYFEKNTTTTASSLASHRRDHPLNKPTLFIGDCIRMHDVVVDICSVIQVDSLASVSKGSSSAGVEVPRFALLVEGRLGPGPSFSSIHGGVSNAQSVFETFRDGATEVNSPRSHAGGENSSADSNDEDHHHSIPPFETERRYLLLFVAVFDDHVPVVECACTLRDHVLHDQIPTSVWYIAPSLAVVSGTNGLLGVVRAGGPAASRVKRDGGRSDSGGGAKTHLRTGLTADKGAPCAMQAKGERQSVTLTSRQPILCEAGPRTTFSFFSLVEDSLQPAPPLQSSSQPAATGAPVEVVASHAGDAAITAVDVHKAPSPPWTSSLPESVVLASGDSTGVVCLWSIDTATGTGALRVPPYKVTSEARRVCSLHVACSGDHVAVGLPDRLLLLAVNPFEGEHREGSSGDSSVIPGSSGGALYVRTFLDVLCGTHARYSVAFGPSFLRVWRVLNEVRSPSCPAASHRTELDSYPEQDISTGSGGGGLSSARSTTALDEDLGTYSIDVEMTAASAGRGLELEVGQRGDSPYNPQSPNPPPPPSRSNSYQPGISITTWLHMNMDVFDERAGSSATDLAAAAASHESMQRALAGAVYDKSMDIFCPESSRLPGLLALKKPSGEDMVVDHAEASLAALDPDVGNALDTQASSLCLHSTNTSATASHAASPRETRFMAVNEEFLPLFEPEGWELLPAPSVRVPQPTLLVPNPEEHTAMEVRAEGENEDEEGDDEIFASGAIPGVRTILSTDAVSFRVVGAQDLTRPEIFSAQRIDSGAGAGAGLLDGVVLDHRARHHFHYSAMGMERPTRSLYRRRLPDLDNVRRMLVWFKHDTSEKFERARVLLSVLSACFQPPSIGILAAALEVPILDVARLIQMELSEFLFVASEDKRSVVTCKTPYKLLLKWLCSEDRSRAGEMFWIDAGIGHNMLCALYLRYCGNKSVAVEHTWQDYLRTYGPTHLRHATRGLRLLTANIRKIDETANIRAHLPRQIGYIVGLYEIYARRVGLRGRLPAELGQLRNLRVLSMGNNHLSGELPASLGELRNLQRIVLHQNNLRGPVPQALGELGCIVNLAGNPLLHHGPDVPQHERQALVDLYTSTRGAAWHTKNYWCTTQAVAKWYKVGVLTSHVHSIVMSSNGMEGRLPTSISQLSFLRMIELATMPGLVGTIPRELCSLTTLRRLCICRCGLTGRIPSEIGQLVGLEELQLFGNALTGSVPASLSNLTNLKLLSLGEYTGGNNFQSEPLPACLSSLRSLEALFMANCNIRGPLPDWIGGLTELRQLDLQRNLLSGALPASIGSLQNLLYLNIKDNPHLTGRLPLVQLLSLSKLNRLSLVHCNFADTDHALEALKMHLPRCKVWI